jgi:capsular polysaccharide transport system permease protein
VTDSAAPPDLAGAPDLAAERARIAQGLAAAAGRKRFAVRRRRFDAGYSERRRARAARLFALASFLALVAAPGLGAIGYFGWLAADRYVAEARFVLAPNKAALGEGAGRAGGAPPIEIARDTQVIAAFLQSRAMVEALEADIGLRARFAAAPFAPRHLIDPVSPDALAGLDPDAPVEDVVDYWEDMTRVSISPSSGIVTFETRAFTPADAQALAEAALARAEAQVNAMNARVWDDALARAEALFAAAAARLGAAQGALAAARDASGVLDATAAAEALTGVAGEARAQLLALREERAAKAAELDRGSPILRALDRRIASLREQIAAIEASMAGDAAAAGETRTLAGVMQDVAALEAEAAVAGRQFLAAAERLEVVRVLADAQSLYLYVFVAPALADEATLPQRGWWIAGALGVGLALWGAATGLFGLVRNHIA